MKLKFDSGLDYQIEAIKSVTDLFEGLPQQSSGLQIPFGNTDGSMFNELGIGNDLMLSPEQILKNLHEIQSRNTVPKSRTLVEPDISYSFPNFSVEMETGTGKTYVYLRTIFELNKLYGFNKFIIVVPSVAIREGVTSSIKLMRDHLKGLYNNVAFDAFVYQSKDLSRVRQFAVNNEVQIMVINIQAFQKDAGENVDYATLNDEQKKKLNVIHQEQDKMSGRRPIEYVQATNPILIIDEPQSVDNTEKSQKAIRNLNPLFCLRYSATHINPYNLLYQLNPIRAYDLHLVKQIEVVDAESKQDYNQSLVRLDSIFYPKNSKTPQAKVTIFEDTPSGTREKQIKIKHGTDLSSQTNHANYEGYLVTNINAEPGNEYVEFQNGFLIQVLQESGGITDERIKSQIEQTVEVHFSKEKKLRDKGIKVLSLFFIDHVKNYRSYDDEGNPQKGKIAEWFEKAYTAASIKPMYKGLIPYSAEEVHDGYFSSDKKKGKIVEFLDTSGGTAKDDETYELIMKDKERLLSADVPLRFIFSHSALKEGWDNPNVFQICTLREMGTDRERRQTIGRGLRLPVNQDGDRIYDEQINRLTVIANETFENFAKGLQSDIEAAIDPNGGFKFGRVPQIAFTLLLNTKGTDYLTQGESKEIWDSIAKQGFIDQFGDFTDKFLPDTPGFKLALPRGYKGLEEVVLNRMRKFLPRDFVKDARKRQKVSYNKRIELNADFKILWDKISQKTRYSVEFKTDKLIELASNKIQNMAEIKPVQIEITKRSLEIKESGIEGGLITSTGTHIASNEQPLPDILAFLQRETELTRGTLVEILKKSGRLKEFSVNPQAFMTEIAKLVNRALHELIIDGIKYEPIPEQYYEMRLFKIQEVEEYLSRLYKVQSKDTRTPYDYIAYESGKEEEVAKLLDCDERVKFFCKLPRWFKIATPLGDYNPDWAVVVEDTHKLYLVRESKSTLDRDKRRESENKKVDCGKAHFKALGVNFKDATTIHEVLQP
ncbi:MAG TPA: type III restriction endonuclease [Lentisphaeria bacterium]|nr:MAG: type III restriction endonuclease [Lentisphaerae bacterium GWF2_50_93]HCE43481.1 type III restriction endonuclease [Lentisphaeria bacterium]